MVDDAEGRRRWQRGQDIRADGRAHSEHCDQDDGRHQMPGLQPVGVTHRRVYTICRILTSRSLAPLWVTELPPINAATGLISGSRVPGLAAIFRNLPPEFRPVCAQQKALLEFGGA